MKIFASTVFLPKTSTFKATVRETERYKRIKSILKSETSIPYIAFIAFIANDFEIFLTMFQSMKPKIHLFSAITVLLEQLWPSLSNQIFYMSIIMVSKK